MYDLHDDIVALATLPGRSALNVIRLSGINAGKIFCKLSASTKGPKANSALPFSVYDCTSNRKIDFAVFTFFKGPKSYTGEDLLEISTHGGEIIANQVIETIITLGARLAKPGEFSYRAYINGKIDLLQAEAISSIVDSNNSLDSFYRLNTIQGALSKRIIASKKRLEKLITVGEHELDFLDEEITKKTIGDYIKQTNNIKKTITEILKNSISEEKQTGNIKIAIIGVPNAGKSSLFNKIIGQPKSIITNIKGTTRDMINSNIYIDNQSASIVDTAGIRRTSNIIELQGIKKTYREIELASIVIIIDEKNPLKIYMKHKNLFKKKAVILVKNKTDLNKARETESFFYISCKTGRGIGKLLTHLSTVCGDKINNIYKQSAFTLNMRQKGLLKKIHISINEAIKALKETQDLTIFLSLIYKTNNMYNDLIGPKGKDEILNSIFKGFCVGK